VSTVSSSFAFVTKACSTLWYAFTLLMMVYSMNEQQQQQQQQLPCETAQERRTRCATTGS
jgi:hypothetical protein